MNWVVPSPLNSGNEVPGSWASATAPERMHHRQPKRHRTGCAGAVVRKTLGWSCAKFAPASAGARDEDLERFFGEEDERPSAPPRGVESPALEQAARGPVGRVGRPAFVRRDGEGCGLVVAVGGIRP